MKWNNFPDHQTLSGFWGALHGGKGGERGRGVFKKSKNFKVQSQDNIYTDPYRILQYGQIFIELRQNPSFVVSCPLGCSDFDFFFTF